MDTFTKKKSKKTKLKKQVKNQFHCDICSYKTNRIDNYNRHCESKNHSAKLSGQYKFKCDLCRSTYVTKNGLLKHIKNKHDSNALLLDKEKDTVKHMLLQMMQDNHDVQDKILRENRELQHKMMELAKEPKIVNQKFNVIQFLNHECKDAMNLSDFIN